MTPREEKVLDALKAFTTEFDYSPSYLELAERAKLRSKSQAYYAISGLVEKGYVERAKRRAHSIRVIEGVPRPPKKKGKRSASKKRSPRLKPRKTVDDPFNLPSKS